MGRIQAPPHPFTYAEWVASGGSAWQLRSGALRRLIRGVYIRSDVPVTPAVWARAAILAAPPQSFASHHTAARLLGGIVPSTSGLHASTLSRHSSRTPDLIVHRRRHRPPLVTIDTVPCSDAATTFLDLAALLDLVDLVVLADSLLQRGHLTVADLAAAAAAHGGRGARAARRAAGLARPGAESAMESRARVLLVMAGLPQPSVNATVVACGARYRLDLSWDEAKVAVEYDGRHHIDREPQWRADLRRRETLESAGWRVIVLTSADLFDTPDLTVTRVRRALVSAGVACPRERPGWQRHFPGRSAAA